MREADLTKTRYDVVKPMLKMDPRLCVLVARYLRYRRYIRRLKAIAARFAVS